MEIKASFKLFGIIMAIAIILFGAGFGFGRGLRLNRVSESSNGIVDGVVSARDTTDKISESTDIAKSAAESSNKTGQLVVDGMSELEQSNEQLQLFYDEVIRAIEADTEITEQLNATSSELYDTTNNALNMAIITAERYEKLIDSLRQASSNYDKNAKQQSRR